MRSLNCVKIREFAIFAFERDATANVIWFLTKNRYHFKVTLLKDLWRSMLYCDNSEVEAKWRTVFWMCQTMFCSSIRFDRVTSNWYLLLVMSNVTCENRQLLTKALFILHVSLRCSFSYSARISVSAPTTPLLQDSGLELQCVALSCGRK